MRLAGHRRTIDEARGYACYRHYNPL